ncbi:hypothetical protein IV203_014897 [Nitzschia inconspicua]|uniref:Uncharacterized protein n=1 Tax=Nitzschia inconspicua TaxID=303405 RepID=A0A9K3L9J3_9STRA|nr:hypothetical protein IV203_020417 [Nitzschia inconspicua]KAG7358309.1 hypothetical protein IV203_014897 [Nitzschia inconspicua]
MPDKCRIEILDSDDIPIQTIDTDPIYAAEEINQDRVLTVTQPETARRKHSVKQNLRHQRLGHRAISTLLRAVEDDVWADVRMIPGQEKFCQTCKITTARKANRGLTPLEQLDELVPGMCVMVDIVKNPVSESITSTTYYPFYLTATNMASRFFVHIGMKRKTADNVFAALQEGAASYGPSAEFNLSMLSRIHDTKNEEEDFNQNDIAHSTQLSSYPESINMSDQLTDAATSPQHCHPQSIRRGNPKYACHTEQYTHQPAVPTPEEYVETVERAYNNEVVQPIQEVTDMQPTMFLPAPDNWKQILKLPPHVMNHWSASLLKELKELVKKLHGFAIRPVAWRLNPATQPGMASNVGQDNASSKVMNHERAFAVTKRSNRFNTQLGPPTPEGSDAGKALFDQYTSSDAGLYTYRLLGKTFKTSNHSAGRRIGTSGLLKSSVKKLTK